MKRTVKRQLAVESLESRTLLSVSSLAARHVLSTMEPMKVPGEFRSVTEILGTFRTDNVSAMALRSERSDSITPQQKNPPIVVSQPFLSHVPTPRRHEKIAGSLVEPLRGTPIGLNGGDMVYLRSAQSANAKLDIPETSPATRSEVLRPAIRPLNSLATIVRPNNESRPPRAAVARAMLRDLAAERATSTGFPANLPFRAAMSPGNGRASRMLSTGESDFNSRINNAPFPNLQAVRERSSEFETRIQLVSTDHVFADFQLEPAADLNLSGTNEAFTSFDVRSITDATLDSTRNSLLPFSDLSSLYSETSSASTALDQAKDYRTTDVGPLGANLANESGFIELDGFSEPIGSRFSDESKWNNKDISLLNPSPLVTNREFALDEFRSDRDSAIAFLDRLTLESAPVQTEQSANEKDSESILELASAEQTDKGIIELPISSAEMPMIMADNTDTDAMSLSQSNTGHAVIYLASARSMSVEAELGLFRAIELVGDDGVGDAPAVSAPKLTEFDATAEEAPTAAVETTRPDSEKLTAALFGFKFDTHTLSSLVPFLPALVLAGRFLTRKPREQDTDDVNSIE